MGTINETNNVMIQKLLCEVSSSLKEYSEKELSRKEPYNIFRVLEVSHREVIMCRMLKDILDPQGSHGKGSCFLKLFLDECLQIGGFSERDFQTAKVYKEYLIPQSTRRIDIVILIGNRFIPIEVKIDAKDQDAQCIDYYLFTRDVIGDTEAEIYYLTKYGTAPSEESVSKKKQSIPADRIKLLSFEKNIRNWLKKCIEMESVELVKVLLEQYLEAIEAITNAIDDEVEEMIEKMLFKSTEYFEAGIMIEKTMESAKINLVKSVFQEIETEMDKTIENLPFTVSKLSWKNYNELLPQYYINKKDIYPGLSYRIDNARITASKHIQLRIELESVLYAGLTVFDTKADGGNGDEVFPLSKADKEKIRKNLCIDAFDDESLQIKWIYLPTGSMEEEKTIPDFRIMNKAAIDLADIAIRREFVNKSVEEIKKQLLDIVISQ